MLQKLYTTDLKYIIPLVGVILAWVLTSAGNFYQSLNTNKKIIGKSLVQLYFFYVERIKIMSLFEFLKDCHGLGEDYERARKKYVERYSLSNQAIKESLETINEISSLYPFIGFQLKSIIESYSLTQKMSFKAIVLNEEKDMYIKLLSIYEVSLEIENKILKKIILTLSFKRGFLTWIKMQRKFYFYIKV